MKEDIDLCTYRKTSQTEDHSILSAMRSYRDMLKKNKITTDYYELNQKIQRLMWIIFINI